MIELINFTKRYNDLLAVDQLNLKIEAGEMFGFIGPNGAGKSTSIRFLATLLKATSGEGIVNGHRVSKDPLAVRRSVGYMPDGFGVYDGMKVWEFLDFFAVAYQLPRARRRQVLNDVMELLDLTGKRDAFVNGLSRGMKQRLCLAKTLVHDPPVLILDEPTSGLDPRARIEVKALFKELRRMGKTILISSHILTELADCCSSIGIIERGKLLMSGPIDEVYRRIRGNRIVRIRFLENMEAGLAIVRSMPETRDVQIEDHHVTVELAADDDQVAGLMEKLVAAGVRMSSFAEKEPTLEDVFMLVTKGSGGVSHVSCIENPVLQRELLVNLRMTRAFVLLFCLRCPAGRWWSTWRGPASERLGPDHASPGRGRAAGRTVLPGPVRAGVADGAQLRGRHDHRRKGAADLRDAAGQPACGPGPSCWASCWRRCATWPCWCFCSLPIVMLCLPLGGVSLYEVLATYVGMAASVVAVRHDLRGRQQLSSPAPSPRWSSPTW